MFDAIWAKIPTMIQDFLDSIYSALLAYLGIEKGEEADWIKDKLGINK